MSGLNILTSSPQITIRNFDDFSSSNVSNISTSTIDNAAVESLPSLMEAITFALVTAGCICATIVGNILVIMSVFTYRPLKTVQNFYIVSLAVADLAVAILVMPFNIANYVIGRWVFGVIFCNMWLTFDILTCTASILNLCAIAIDRYYAIHDPLRYAQKRTMKRVLVSILLVWGASAVISVPPLLGWNNRPGTNLYDAVHQSCQLTNEKSFVIYSASGSFYIPLVIMTFVYIKIFLAARRRLRARARAAAAAKHATVLGNTAPTPKGISAELSSTESPEQTQEHVTNFNTHDKHNDMDDDEDHTNNRVSENHEHKTRLASPPAQNDTKMQIHKFMEERQRISLSKERRAARTMAIIMGCFVFCWLPFFLMYVSFAFCDNCAETTDPRVINFIVWLGYVNSTLNPIIYTIFNIDFRKSFKNLLQGKTWH